MKVYFLIATLISFSNLASANSTIEDFLASYEKAREEKRLKDWRTANTHPKVYANLSDAQKLWKSIQDCDYQLHKSKLDQKDLMLPAYETIEISDYTESENPFSYYPVKPDKTIRLIYPKGTFIKGTRFDITNLNGRWYRVPSIETDEFISTSLKDNNHYMYVRSPSCFAGKI